MDVDPDLFGALWADSRPPRMVVVKKKKPLSNDFVVSLAILGLFIFFLFLLGFFISVFK